MKRNILKGASLMLVASMAFVACKKDEVVLPTATSEATKATLTGKAFAELDLNTPGLEKAPDGTIVVVQWTSGSQNFTYTGTVASGVYSVSIPVGSNSRSYTVKFSGFTADQTQLTGQLPATVAMEYTKTDENVTLIGGIVLSRDVKYTAATKNDYSGIVVGKAILTGKAMYNSNMVNDTTNTWARDGKPAFFTNYDGYSDDNDDTNVPDGTKVTFVTDAGKRYETTVSAGAFKFEIEAYGSSSISGNIYFEDFSATQTQSTGSFPATKTKTFACASQYLTLTAGMTKAGSNQTDWTGLKYYRFN